MKKFFVVALIAVALALASVATACKDDDDDGGNGDLGEPDIKTFSDIALFETYTATIKDERTNCGKQNLQQLGIVEKLQNAIIDAFNDAPSGPAGNAHKTAYRSVFGAVDGVTIIVDNPSMLYKAKAPNGNKLYFHKDYLSTVSVADLQTAITAAVTAMNPAYPDLPFNAE